MQRHELEVALEKLIAQSGVDTEEVIETLERMIERYNDQLSQED